MHERHITDALGMDIPVQIEYMYFELESNGMLDDASSERTKCHADYPKHGHPHDNPCDEVGSHACYYYKLYVDRCTDGKTYKRCGTYKTLVEGHGWDIGTLLGGSDSDDTKLDSLIKNLDVQVRGSIILVIWDRIAEPVSSITVTAYEDNRLVKASNVRNNSYIHHNYDPETEYQFKITVTPVSGAAVTKITEKIGTAPTENYNPEIKAVLQSDGSIRASWRTPDALDEYDELRIYKDGRKVSDTNIRDSQTSYTYSRTVPGSTYYFELEVDYDKRTKEYGRSQDFRSNSIAVPLDCAADEIQQGSRCVDRCPASNEEWRSDTCMAVSCPAGQEIKGNACVAIPKPVIPEPVTPDKPSAVTSDSDEIWKIHAGAKHKYVYEYLSPKPKNSTGFWGTIAYTGHTNDGIPVFIGAAHTFVPDKDMTYRHPTITQHFHEYRMDGKNVAISDAEPTSPYFDYGITRHYDAALIKIDPDIAMPSGQLMSKNSTTTDLMHGNSAALKRGDDIHILNSNREASGIVLYKEATISLYDHLGNRITMPNQTISHYTSVPGDSGSPIVQFVNNTATIVGIHAGSACIFESVSEGLGKTDVSAYVVDESGAEILCGYKAQNKAKEHPNIRPISWHYKFFSPWDPIRTGLDLQ